MSEPETDVAASDPVRRGLVAYAETINERDRLRREMDDMTLRLGQEQTRSSGLENELRRAEIHRDEARVSRDAAIRETAKYETWFEMLTTMVKDFRAGPSAGIQASTAQVMVALAALNGSATPAGDTAAATEEPHT